MNYQDIENCSDKLDNMAKSFGLKTACEEVGIKDISDVKYAMKQRCLRYIAENGNYEFNPGKTSPVNLTSEDKALLEMMAAAATDGFILGMACKMGLKPDKPQDTNYLFN